MGKTWFSSLSLLPEFGRRLRNHWVAAVMGGTVPGIGLFVWSLIGSLPHWTVGLILVGALLFSAYFTWRDEYLARQQTEQKIRVKITSAIASDGWTWSPISLEAPATEPNKPISALLGVRLELIVFNAGPPTVIDDWELLLPDGSVAVAFDTLEKRLKSPWPPSKTAEEFRLTNNVRELAESPLPTGQRKELLLDFQSADLEIAKSEELKKDGSLWVLMFGDASGTRYEVNLLRRRGHIYEQADEFSPDWKPNAMAVSQSL